MIIKLFCSADQFYDHIMQELVKIEKFSWINKQSDVKFRLNRMKFGAVSYLLSCISFSSYGQTVQVKVSKFRHQKLVCFFQALDKHAYDWNLKDFTSSILISCLYLLLPMIQLLVVIQHWLKSLSEKAISSIIRRYVCLNQWRKLQMDSIVVKMSFTSPISSSWTG